MKSLLRVIWILRSKRCFVIIYTENEINADLSGKKTPPPLFFGTKNSNSVGLLLFYNPTTSCQALQNFSGNDRFEKLPAIDII